MANPNCYECKHREEIPDDAHSRCNHPIALEIQKKNSVLVRLAKMGISTAPAGKVPGIEVEGDPYGIMHGWFSWPFNFDPVWLISCKGFEKKVAD